MERPPYYPSPPVDDPHHWYDNGHLVALVALVGLLVVVAVGLIVVLNVRGGETASTTPTPSASVMQSAEPTPTPDPDGTPTAEPSASPTPGSSSPARTQLAQGWARIEDGLHLRNGPGESAAIIRDLQAREVVWVNSDPERSGGQNWYFVMTLDGDGGWIASGLADDPYATSLSNRFVMSQCGQIATAGAYGVVNGLRTARLNEFELATVGLATATSTTGCVRFSFEDYSPTSRLVLDVHACGAPSWDGSVMRLQPTTAGSVDASSRVSSEVVVPDILLTRDQRVHDDGLTNSKKVLILGSRLAEPFGCVQSRFIRRDFERLDEFVPETTGCYMITARSRTGVTVAPAAGGEAVTFSRESRGTMAEVANNEPSVLRVLSGYQRFSVQLIGEC